MPFPFFNTMKLPRIKRGALLLASGSLVSLGCIGWLIAPFLKSPRLYFGPSISEEARKDIGEWVAHSPWIEVPKFNRIALRQRLLPPFSAPDTEDVVVSPIDEGLLHVQQANRDFVFRHCGGRWIHWAVRTRYAPGCGNYLLAPDVPWVLTDDARRWQEAGGEEPAIGQVSR